MSLCQCLTKVLNQCNVLFGLYVLEIAHFDSVGEALEVVRSSLALVVHILSHDCK